MQDVSPAQAPSLVISAGRAPLVVKLRTEQPSLSGAHSPAILSGALSDTLSRSCCAGRTNSGSNSCSAEGWLLVMTSLTLLPAAATSTGRVVIEASLKSDGGSDVVVSTAVALATSRCGSISSARGVAAEEVVDVIAALTIGRAASRTLATCSCENG